MKFSAQLKWISLLLSLDLFVLIFGDGVVRWYRDTSRMFIANIVESYSPFDDPLVKDTEYASQFADRFVTAFNPEATKQIIREINSDIKDRPEKAARENLMIFAAIGLACLLLFLILWHNKAKIGGGLIFGAGRAYKGYNKAAEMKSNIISKIKSSAEE